MKALANALIESTMSIMMSCFGAFGLSFLFTVQLDWHPLVIGVAYVAGVILELVFVSTAICSIADNYQESKP